MHSNGWHEGSSVSIRVHHGILDRRSSKESEAPDRIRVMNVKDHWDHSGAVGLSFVDLQFYRAPSGNALTHNNVQEKRKTRRKSSDFLAILHARYTISRSSFPAEREINPPARPAVRRKFPPMTIVFRFNIPAPGPSAGGHRVSRCHRYHNFTRAR